MFPGAPSSPFEIPAPPPPHPAPRARRPAAAGAPPVPRGAVPPAAKSRATPAGAGHGGPAMRSAEAARSKAAAGVAGRVGSNPATSFRAAARVRRATLREAVPEQAALDRDRALTEDRPAEAGTRAAAVRIAALGQAPVERQVAEGEPTGARGDVVLRGRTSGVSADEEEAEVRRRCGT